MAGKVFQRQKLLENLAAISIGKEAMMIFWKVGLLTLGACVFVSGCDQNREYCSYDELTGEKLVCVSMTEAEYDIARARDDIEAITNAVDQFTIDLGKIPSQEQGIVALLKPPEGVDTSRYPPDGYLAGVLDDPWDNPYQYVTPAQRSEDAFDVFSFGPDGVSNTDDDIGNWN